METRLKCSETEEEKETVTVEKWTQLRYPGILRVQGRKIIRFLLLLCGIKGSCLTLSSFQVSH